MNHPFIGVILMTMENPRWAVFKIFQNPSAILLYWFVWRDSSIWLRNHPQYMKGSIIHWTNHQPTGVPCSCSNGLWQQIYILQPDDPAMSGSWKPTGSALEATSGASHWKHLLSNRTPCCNAEVQHPDLLNATRFQRLRNIEQLRYFWMLRLQAE